MPVNPARQAAVAAAARHLCSPCCFCLAPGASPCAARTALCRTVLRCAAVLLQSKSMLSVRAHDADVNVISWSRGTTYMLASGGDDGVLRVWDLRALADGAFVANFAYHRWVGGAVCEWCGAGL